MLEAACPPAHPREVGAWVDALASGELARRAKKLSSMESVSRVTEELAAPAIEGKTAEPVTHAVRPGESRRSIVPWIGVIVATGSLAWVMLTRRAPASPEDERVPRAAVAAPPQAALPSVVPPSSVAESPPPAPAANQPAPVSTGSVRAGKRRAATKSDCRSPYFVDAEGLKRYKPECLK